jgi:phosphatidylglycerol:prolipoprotein diacylglycerol transferase
MTHYIHNINPIVFKIGGPLAVRWYGLSYLLGFIAAILLLKHWSKKGEFEVPPVEVSNFVVMLAFFGVFLGGRLGYILLYGFNSFLADPLYLFRVWEGGMASHGGLVGVILFMLWYAKKHNHSFWNLTDNMACTASLGIAFGRLANFVNGELWGRVTTVKWGMIFPEELNLRYGEYTTAQIQQLVDAGQILPRHPSQLYQAGAEGFLVFGLVLLIRRTAWGKRPGALSTSFLLLYAIARIGMEFFREPDSTIYFGWLTKGQLYSILMLLGAALIARKKNLVRATPVSPPHSEKK